MSSQTIFALVPHYGRNDISNQWLGQCIESLLQQTLALDGIIVVDDASPCSPEAIIGDFPTVSLYRNKNNTGPFSIIDRVFTHAGVDALLLQDSDDWSSPDRLRLLLDGMTRWQADIVGCQIRTVDHLGSALSSPFDQLPLQPRKALLENPIAHTVILPSTLTSCDFVRKIGGFSTALRFGADSEFVRRACFAGVVRNIAKACYCRRIHPDSLTQAPSTGYGSPKRVAVQTLLQDHARSLVASYHADKDIDLKPRFVAQTSRLYHVLGPTVAGL